MKHASKDDDGEAFLRPEAFEKLAQERYLFNENSYEKWMKGAKKGLCPSLSALPSEWPRIKALLKHTLRFFPPSSLDHLLSRVDLWLGGQVSLEGLRGEAPKIWLNYRLLEMEVERLHCEAYVANLLPDEVIHLEEVLTSHGIVE